MNEKIAPLNKNQHAKLRVKASSDFAHGAGQHLIPVTIHEYVQVSAQQPIIFVRESADSENFVSCTLMGLTQGENVYCGHGDWSEPYVPAALRSYPFSIGQADEEGKEFLICIDENSDLIGEEEGESLFDENGEQTEYLKERSNLTGQFIEHMQITNGFIKFLQDNDLLVSNDLTIKLENGENYNINGIFRVDEQKLNELPAETFEDMRKRGLLPPIFAHLNSLQQVQRVARKKMQVTAN